MINSKTITMTTMAMMSVLALISCQVAEITEPVQDKDFPTGAVVTLTSDESVSTRTQWNGYTIHWSQGDAFLGFRRIGMLRFFTTF